MSALSRPTWWVGIINAVSTPLGLLALLALIALTLLAYIVLIPGNIIGLRSQGTLSVIVILGAILLGIAVISGIYVFRLSRLTDERVVAARTKPEDTPFQLVLDVFAREPIIVSALPIMVITVPDLVVRRVSRSVMGYFGYESVAPVEKIIGKTLPQLMSDWAPFVDPVYWSDLGKDQERVIHEVMAGRITYARVPVRINNTHPSDEFRNKTFVPIITERLPLESGDETRIILTMLYLDVATLPKDLSITSVWEDLTGYFDPQQLAEDLRKIRQVYDDRTFVSDWDGGDRRRNALANAIEKLENGGSPTVLDDLSKAGWFDLRDAATTLKKPPQAALNLIDRVLGPV